MTINVPRSTQAGTAQPMYIGGAEVWARLTFGVINPATGKIFAEAPDCSPEQLDAAMQAAADAFPSWGSCDVAVRRVALLHAAEVLDAAQDQLAELLTLEQGKPLASSRREIADIAKGFRFIAGVSLDEEIVQDDGVAAVRVTHRPLGVVAAITPWNFPILLMGMKLGPALLAGNTVVVKPSPFTPLTTLAAGRMIAEMLPAGVLNIVSGGNDLGARMTQHPAVSKVSFTGSVATGLRVAAAAASDLKRYTLELGGNDAAIVLDDADPAAIVNGLFWGAFTNSGQICAGIKRLFLPEALHDVVVAGLVERAARVRLGDGLLPGMHLGPINNLAQFERVKALVAEAVGQGATAVIGGAPTAGAGYFYPLTILTGATDTMKIVREEQFGPALPILSYRSVDEAVARANNTEYGLSGSVWGRDVARGAAVAARLDCGTQYVNTHLALEPHIPFGGIKRSGVGVENGHWGLREFTDLRVSYIASPRH